MKQLMYQFRN